MPVASDTMKKLYCRWNFTIYFLIGRSGPRRYLGKYTSTSLDQLRLDLLDAEFDIAILSKGPNDPLHAISWVN